MRLLLAVLVLLCIALVNGDVTLNVPLYAQLPQIAHSGTPYTWTFGPSTFGFAVSADQQAPSSPPSLSYNTTGMPSWVQFDAATQTFSGSPSSSDVGGNRITVTAFLSDTTMAMGGNTSDSSSFTLLVLDEPAPTLNIPIAQQLPAVSSLGAKNMLPGNVVHLPLGWSFSIGLQGDTFSISDGSEVFMSASINGNTELPSWMTWSADTFTLYGIAPTQPGPEGAEFDVVVTGSNKPDFGGTSDTLKLRVSAHALSLDGTLRSINASVGDTFTYQIPTTALELDGRQNDKSTNPITITPDLALTPWITFDQPSGTLTGSPPFDQFKDANMTQLQLVPLNFTDSFGNSVASNLTINISPFAFTAQSLPNVFVDGGMTVNVSLGQFLRSNSLPTSLIVLHNLASSSNVSNGQTINVTFDPVNASSWLNYDPNSLLLTGTVPSQGSGRIKVNLHSINAANQTSSAFFYVTDKGDNIPTTVTGNNAAHGKGSSGGLSHRAKLALAGSLGGVGGLALLIALMICCRRHVAKEEHDHNGVIHDDDDERTLTDTSSRRKFKKAIVLRKGGEAMTPSTMISSPYIDPEKQSESSSPQAFRGIVVEDWSGEKNGGNDEPTQSRMMSNLFGGKRKSSTANKNATTTANANAGLGLGLGVGGLDQQDDPYTRRVPTIAISESQRRMNHSRSQVSVRSNRSSWESDLFYENQENRRRSLGVPEVEDVPRRRGGGGSGLNVRHRNTHINESPAFHAAGVFTPPEEVGMSNNDSRGQMSLDTEEDEEEGSETYEDTQTGLALPHNGTDEAQIMEAKVMQVKMHSPMMQSNNNPFSRTVGRSAEAMDNSYSGAFDDAEDEDGMEALRPTRRREANGKNRASVLSTMTDNSQMQAMRTHFANEEAAAAAAAASTQPHDVFSPNPSFMDGASLSGYEPQETMRAILPRPRTPPRPIRELNVARPAVESPTKAKPSRANRPRSGSSASSRHMPCPNVPAIVNFPIRFHIYPIVPPPMAGAPGSPGKRSGDTKRYSLVLDDARPHLSPYRMMWPDMLADWLTFDEATFEAFGFVPEEAGLEDLGDVEIALISTRKAARVPPSPRIGGGGSPTKTPTHKRNSTMSMDSSHTAMTNGEDDIAIVARARLVFQATPHAF